jgi:hypothetical protein
MAETNQAHTRARKYGIADNDLGIFDKTVTVAFS